MRPLQHNFRGYEYTPLTTILEGFVARLKHKPRTGTCPYKSDPRRLYWFFGYDEACSIFTFERMWEKDNGEFVRGSTPIYPEIVWSNSNATTTTNR